ncbi:MAG: LemA family protein [Phycisphaerae bacterium]
MNENIGIYVILGVVAVFLIWVITMYNSLVRLKYQCRDAWSNIDTELKRRYELIPNLVETVKGYAKHEQETFKLVTEARNRAVASTGSPASQAKDENAFVNSLRQLFAVSESYPDLKASQNFLKLQSELANTEDRIQAARRFYNGNVRDLNTRIEVFPSNFIASLFSFKEEEFFEIEDTGIRNTPQVKL